MPDPYRYWYAKLAGQNPDPPEDRTVLPCGYWRLRDDRPLAVFIGEDKEVVAKIGWENGPNKIHLLNRAAQGRMAEMGGFGEAISWEAWQEAQALGRWADVPPPAETVPSSGHNQPPVGDDPAERKRREIEQEIANSDEAMTKPIADAEEANLYANWLTRIRKFKVEAKVLHDEEKAPILVQANAIDQKWYRLVTDPADALMTRLKEHIRPWTDKLEAAERARLVEARRIADEALRVAEEAREQREREADQGNFSIDSEIAVQAAEALAADAAQEAVEQRVSIGRAGSRVTPRKTFKPVVTDYAAAVNFLLTNEPTRAEICTLVDKLAARLIRAGGYIPGVTVERTTKL